MSLNYTTLQAAILAQAVQPALTTEVVQFIRMAEAMIRREVIATEQRATLTDSDRSSGGIYNLSGQVQDVRAVFGTAENGETFKLANVGLAGIRQLPSDATPQHYALSGQTIEFRGVPGSTATFEVVYMGWPDALDTTATNSLLTNFEDLYMYGALFHLYNFTQDLELAQASLSAFTDAVEKVNQLVERQQGAGAPPSIYNFGHVTVSRGY